MSWDVSIVNVHQTKLATLRENQAPTLGPNDELRAKIEAAFPGVTWNDPSWGFFRGDEYRIEFSLDFGTTTKTLGLHVRGRGNPVSAITKFASQNGWSALDGDGNYMDPNEPTNPTWLSFQGLVNSVAKSVEDAGVKIESKSTD